MRRPCASLGTTRQAGQAGHTEETAPKAVSGSFSEEEEGADAEVAEEAQGMEKPKKEGADASARDASTTTTGSGNQANTGSSKQVNRAGDSHCYNCGKTDHWVYECPDLTAEQQAQLHMHIKAKGEEGEEQQESHQLLNVSMLQGDTLPDNRAYLDR